jgi:hypothetical protein
MVAPTSITIGCLLIFPTEFSDAVICVSQAQRRIIVEKRHWNVKSKQYTIQFLKYRALASRGSTLGILEGPSMLRDSMLYAKPSLPHSWLKRDQLSTPHRCPKMSL